MQTRSLHLQDFDPGRDGGEVSAFVRRHWHAPHIVVRGELYHPARAKGFIMRRGDEIVGLVTYLVQDDSILMLTQNSTEPGMGIGSKLVLRVIDEARRLFIRRIWLTTTNDNLQCLGFFQKLGFRMCQIYPDAASEARRTIKPELPETGSNGIPIRDEIELELVLNYQM